MSFTTIWEQSVNSSFICQVQVAIVKAAIAISAEAPETANHTNRAAYALAVLRSPGSYAANMALGIATDATVQATPTDDAIYNAVAGQWNAYAGTA
jgi:hypothetical protein